MCESRDLGPYEEVLEALHSISRGKGGVSREAAKEELELQPGLFFSASSTWDGIFGRMESWGWLEDRDGTLHVEPARLETLRAQR